MRVVLEKLDKLTVSVECVKEELGEIKRSRSVPSSRQTPRISGIGTPIGGMKSGHKSVEYYFKDLYQHFKANNDVNRYSIACTKLQCEIFDGKNPVYVVPVDKFDSTSMRNLSMMLYASDYKVQTFLNKVKNGDFGLDYCEGLHTPPLFNQRSNVYAIAR